MSAENENVVPDEIYNKHVPNTFSFIVIQLSYSAANIPAGTLPLNKVIVIFSF